MDKLGVCRKTPLENETKLSSDRERTTSANSFVLIKASFLSSFINETDLHRITPDCFDT